MNITQTLLRLLILILILLCLLACHKDEFHGFNEPIVKELKGNWTIYRNDSIEGEIIFSDDSNIRMFSKRGNIDYGDYSEYPEGENTIVITYAEDELGNEIITDDEYEAGGIYVWYKFLTSNKCEVINLPYYPKEKLIIQK